MNKDIFAIIDTIEPPTAPLTTQEENQILTTVLGKKRQAAKKKRIPLYLKTTAALAACLLLLVGVNAANPVFAENLPLIGNVFSWFNHDAQENKRQLISDRLPEVAVPIQQPAEAPKDCPYTLEINQVYCDALYLRFTSTITTPDDSLSDYDFLVSEGTVGENPDFAITNTDTGEKLSPDIFSPWEQADSKTFVNELIFDLSQWPDLPETLNIQFTSGSIVTYHPEDNLETKEAYDANKFIVNQEGYRVDFQVTVDESLTRKSGEQTVNGIELSAVTAAVGETRVRYTLPGADYTGVVFIVTTEDGKKLQAFGGRVEPAADGYSTGYCDYDAVPTDCSTLYITAYDKNTDETLAKFTALLD